MTAKPDILIIDDDIALLKMGEELLGESYNISLAKSGEQALRLLGSGFLPNLILLDISMPGMDGYQTLEGIRNIEHAAEVPVIFLTGLRDMSAEVKGLGAGAADYITKPFVKEILLARIKVQLERGQQRRAAAANQIDEAAFAQLETQLTPTESRIARLLLNGYSNKEIGEELHYSYAYVKKVVAIIFEKAGVNRRQDLRKLYLSGSNIK